MSACRTVDQARAVITFMDAASEKLLRSTVTPRPWAALRMSHQLPLFGGNGNRSHCCCTEQECRH